MSTLQAIDPIEFTNIGTSRGSPSSAPVTRTAQGDTALRCNGGEYLGLGVELTGGTPGTVTVQVREGSSSGRVLDEVSHAFTAVGEGAFPSPVRKRFDGELTLVCWGAVGDEDLRVTVEVAS